MTRGDGITLDSVVAARPDLVAAPMDDKLVMLDLAKGKYFGLDDVATAIWTAIAAPVRVADLCADLMARYNVAPEICRADTLEFLNRLREEGLVKVYEPSGR
jgi:hypothetical protein